MFKEPKLIEFPQIGNSSLGYISVAEGGVIPFKVERIYWTYFTPESVERGWHAHYELEQILVAVAGKIIVNIELLDRQKKEFILDSPYVGLYIPKNTWRIMKYTHNAVQMCIASNVYEEKDYIRQYEEFKKLQL